MKELFQFMIERKKYWLAPVIIVLLFISILIVFSGGSAFSPFIYTLF
jgi:competence protein ComGC